MDQDQSNAYSPTETEGKWQKIWDERGTNSFTPDMFKSAEAPFYNLMMFPYPSAEGLHTRTEQEGRIQELYARVDGVVEG